jgi:arabinose-5-phosphate isomerase
VIETEAEAVRAMLDRVDGRFIAAARHMLACQGRIVVLGMGKSGHIAGKIAATLASTGTPAFFVHPGDASHGDMGMITDRDVVLALSNSGETQELVVLLPLIKRLGVPLITMTGNPNSTLARAADVSIDVTVAKEACPLGLAPTASTTAALVMGDALAIALLQARGFSAADFALAHPGGTLGRRLLLRIDDIMHTGDGMPMVRAEVVVGEALLEMTRKGLGMTVVVGDDREVVGIFTDGDLRRTLDQGLDVRALRIGDAMTRSYKRIGRHALAAEALGMMQKHKINALPVVDDGNRLIGVVNMHDLLRAGVL